MVYLKGILLLKITDLNHLMHSTSLSLVINKEQEVTALMEISNGPNNRCLHEQSRKNCFD